MSIPTSKIGFALFAAIIVFSASAVAMARSDFQLVMGGIDLKAYLPYAFTLLVVGVIFRFGPRN